MSTNASESKIGKLRNKKKYKYQSKILNPLAGQFPEDMKRIKEFDIDRHLRDHVLQEIKQLRLINEILAVAYGTPTLGNMSDPVDEFIYLTISQVTKLTLAKRVYQKLKETFPIWEDLLNNETKALEILSMGGRGRLRLQIITKVLRKIESKFGKICLDSLKLKETGEIEDILTNQLEIGEKTAYCLMIYSFGRKAFPVDSNIVRVLSRIGYFKEFIDFNQDQKKIQSILASIVPLEIGYSLHVNMVVHGRSVCKKEPRCHLCPITKFCDFVVNQEKEKTNSSEYKAVDLFAGPGGFSLGFLNAGWSIVYGIEWDKCAGTTYRFNHPKTAVVQKDISKVKPQQMQKLAENTDIDAILAGVPCQGFSLVGYRVRPDLEEKPSIDEDPRNSLYRYVFRAVRQHKPKVVIFENVKGMSTGTVLRNNKSKNILHVLKKQFEKLGYKCIETTLDTSLFGVPQTRKRIFVIGSRVCDPTLILKQIDSKIVKSECESVGQAFENLPVLEQNDGIPIMRQHLINLEGEESIWGPKTPRKVLFGHISRPHNDYDMEIIEALKQGMNYKRLCEEMPEIIERRKQSSLVTYKTTHFHDKFYRLVENLPSRTIVSHLAKDGNSFIHPTQNRSITPREAARIQGFPDDYLFFGSRSSQFKQIGNAVPPPLARVIAEAVGECLKKIGDNHS